MLRNKGWAVELINIIAEEPTGAGMNRAEIRLMFCASDSGSGLGSEYAWDTVDYHLHLLETAGFVKLTKDEERAYDYFEMTWAGHDYLEANAPWEIPADFVAG
ncbi:DUF2513 domain-containing protein [Pseudomonas sp. RA_35y_Pfl2_P32]|uniref:DUF2513 domain-containing protein n=1 Tax=Pseudomonas sp. RA_35y_Pfl2_P32 TaxID=3088705 RepID=UPI0030D7FD06